MLTRLLKLGNMYFHQQVDANEPGIKIIDWFTIRPLHHSFGIEDNWVFHLVEQTTVVFTGLNRPVRKPSVPNTCYNGSLCLSPSKATVCQIHVITDHCTCHLVKQIDHMKQQPEFPLFTVEINFSQKWVSESPTARCVLMSQECHVSRLPVSKHPSVFR